MSTVEFTARCLDLLGQFQHWPAARCFTTCHKERRSRDFRATLHRAGVALRQRQVRGQPIPALLRVAAEELNLHYQKRDI